jgi:NADH:ubiquinone reductase (H+-translocating)
VDIRLNTRLAGATGEFALLQSGERIPTKTLVSTVPSAPNPLVAALPCKKQHGRIVVNQYLELPDYPGVWSVGDCAWILDAQTKEPCPPTAQHAIRQGARLARNLVASLDGKPQQGFAFKALGKLAALGHQSAVADVMGLKISGFMGWLLWRAIYLMKMPGLERKVRVSSDWFLDLLLPTDIVQLKLGKSASVGREHYEEQSVVFRQGDRGDRLYIVVDGQVEIVRQDAGREEQILGQIGPGECFGEMALVNENPRMATARTVTDTNLLSLDRDAFHALFAYHPPLRKMFEQLMSQRLEADADKIASRTAAKTAGSVQ